MAENSQSAIAYKRSRFSTRLPSDRLYTPSHCWLSQTESGVWRIGLTRFATRMLGELVEHDFDVKPGTRVEIGDVIGWIEGFKAVSDLFCVATGEFAGGNAVLTRTLSLAFTDSYDSGWLYQIRGQPDPTCVDVHGYIGILDLTIDKMLNKPTESKPPC